MNKEEQQHIGDPQESPGKGRASTSQGAAKVVWEAGEAYGFAYFTTNLKK